MNPKIAIVHDFLQTFGGAERVTLALSELYPEAPIYTLTYNKKLNQFFGNKKIVTSYLQPWSWLPTKFLLPFYPQAIESFNFNDFDIVISSSHSFAKNIITSPDTTHISYIHSPMRYVWDYWHSYLKDQKLIWPVKPLVANFLHNLRIWDWNNKSPARLFVRLKFLHDRLGKIPRQNQSVIRLVL